MVKIAKKKKKLSMSKLESSLFYLKTFFYMIKIRAADGEHLGSVSE